MSDIEQRDAEFRDYDERFESTLEAVRRAARIGRWAKRLSWDNDEYGLRGEITVSSGRPRQAIEIVVLPADMYLVLRNGSEYERLDESDTVTIERALATVHAAVKLWRKRAVLLALP